MKKIYITLILAIMLIFPQVVLAAGGVSISAPSSVESGNNVTIKVTISNVAAWNIKITASGATDGVTKSYADATEDALNTTKTFSITCNSKGTGSINIKVSGDVTTQDGKNTDISSSKTISVTAKTTPVPTPTPAPTPKPTPSNPSSKPNTENGGTTQNQQPQSKPNQNTNTNSPQTQTSKQNEDIREKNTIEVPIKGKPNVFRQKLLTSKYIMQMVVESTVVPNLYDSELQDSYGVKTPEDLVYAMIDDPGEYNDLCAWIQKLNGFDVSIDEKVEEAKN